ncbi:ATP-binding cassette domain-containing protein [Chryseobacterium oryctis]|uniref:ATP-binding cassette domain-containing protein n=1 Tax=Chryseobacterium oryctis TaxID=2952618 RepID=A0ABT3HIV0_9FLAO|nr:ATP-binding cassette domain-containing protein [Chryseobacterium oryctis]MCW3159707.1 ATP-binding cassette domain-containing protein [Chryseobacterium oryctis]
MSKLHIDSITKSYGSKKVLQDIYLSCETGKITGILGRNGEGKSTLMQIIFGTIKADFQFIKIDQKILKNQFDRKGNITYLPQHSFLPKNTKIKNLIELFCNKENSKELFNSDLIKPFLNQTSRSLSEGEKRFLEVLLLSYSDSKFVLLDEPFHSLSPKLIEKTKAIILEKSKEKGFIISDHNYQDILDISTDIYLLSNTHIRKIKDLKELQQFNYLPKSI